MLLLGDRGCRWFMMNANSRVFYRNRSPGAGEARTCLNRMLVKLQPEVELLPATLVFLLTSRSVFARVGVENTQP